MDTFWVLKHNLIPSVFMWTEATVTDIPGKSPYTFSWPIHWQNFLWCDAHIWKTLPAMWSLASILLTCLKILTNVPLLEGLHTSNEKCCISIVSPLLKWIQPLNLFQFVVHYKSSSIAANCISGIPKLSQLYQHYQLGQMELTCENLRRKHVTIHVSIHDKLRVKNILVQQYSWHGMVLINLSEYSIHKLDTRHYQNLFLPTVVAKCSWATRVFAHRLFRKSQTLRVLSSEQLTTNLPPGWNSTHLTQLSWPTWRKQKQQYK